MFSIKIRFETNEFENPLRFDLVKYMGKKRKPFDNKNQNIVNSLMKFGDHFFTFYLISPLKIQILYYDLILLFIYLLNIPFFTLGFIFYFNYYNDERLLLGLIFLLLSIIFPIFFFFNMLFLQ